VSNELKLKEALQRVCSMHDQKGDFWLAIADAKALMMELYPEKREHIPYQWKVIPNFSKYEVSTTGEVRRAVDGYKCRNILVPKGMILKPYTKNNGYVGYRLVDNEGKQRDISGHRLVAMTYLPHEIKRGYIVAHLDGCKSNNDVNNLKWVSNSENQLHRRAHEKEKEYAVAKLSAEQVQEARKLYADGYSQAELSRKYVVSHGVINKMINQVTYLKEVYNA
jgi:hypothetical protein